jgi:hypothetical protein
VDEENSYRVDAKLSENATDTIKSLPHGVDRDFN